MSSLLIKLLDKYNIFRLMYANDSLFFCITPNLLGFYVYPIKYPHKENNFTLIKKEKQNYLTG